MKKRLLALVLALVIITALAACSASSNSKGETDMAASQPAEPAPASEAEMRPETPTEDGYEYQDEKGGIGGDAAAQTTAESFEFDTEKIIYSAYAEIETQDFDKSVEGVYAMIEKYQGFLESSSVNGGNYYAKYYDETSNRSASFTIRVPRDNFKTMLDSLSELGNVPYSTTSTQNITTQYVDTESRLKSYRTQEERLLEFMEKAETVEDMLAIEARLAEVRYNIESLTTTLQGWDSLIYYSTVTLNLSEVEEYTEQVPVQRTYWQEDGDALSNTLEGIGDFFKGLLKYVIAALPILAMAAVVVIVVLLVAKRRHGKKQPPEDQDK
jgi:hypothetical protein